MSIARRDDRHNADLVREIADGFNRAVGSKAAQQDAEGGKTEAEQAAEPSPPQFVVTGDRRDTPKKRRD